MAIASAYSNSGINPSRVVWFKNQNGGVHIGIEGTGIQISHEDFVRIARTLGVTREDFVALPTVREQIRVLPDGAMFKQRADSPGKGFIKINNNQIVSIDIGVRFTLADFNDIDTIPITVLYPNE